MVGGRRQSTRDSSTVGHVATVLALGVALELRAHLGDVDNVGGLDRGLLVTRFHYTNPVHPKLAQVTGMTRDGLFLVDSGTIV